MGYRRNRSTMTAVLQMYDRWVTGASDGKISGIVLLDLSAAFDLVNPELLLEKMKIYGLEPEFVEWIESYMTDRKQAVWIDSLLSDWLDIKVGVPQGSLLGPLLFIVFANDFTSSLSCDLDTYADDSTLTSTKDTLTQINDELNENCNKVTIWMKENKLCLNAGKTHLLVAGTSQRLARVMDNESIDIEMDNHQLEESEEGFEVILGVHLQPNLKWNIHLQELMKKLKNRITGLSKVRLLLPLKQRKIISEGIFTSILVYCMPVWGGADKGGLSDLQVLQNKAAQLVLNMPPRTNRNLMFDKLEWMSVNQLIFYHSILAVYKIRNAGEPEYLASKLSNDNFRGSIIEPNTTLTLAKNSFCYRGPAGWNKLPQNIRNLPKLANFKKELKKWTKQNIPRFLDQA